MPTYYVSANGFDLHDGLSPQTAWASIQKVVATVQAGDEVRFRCGDTFYGRIEAPNGNDPKHPTVYTCYGEGEKPKISEYKTIKKGFWVQVSENIYKIDLSDANCFDGCKDDLGGNAGLIKADGKLFVGKVFSYDQLTKQWDFYTADEDNATLFVFSEQAPDLLAEKIEICCRTSHMVLHDCVTVQNLVFIGSGACSVHGICKHVWINNCEFHEIGGSRLDGFKDNQTRYGNGVEFWAGSRDCLVENCKFSNIYDVAMTMQGPMQAGMQWKNIFFSHNLVWDCTQAFEIWCRGTEADTGFVNCTFDHNTCINCGYGWGAEVRPDQSVRAPLLMYAIENPLCDIKVHDNIFSKSRYLTLYKRGGFSRIPTGYRLYNNTVIRSNGQPIVNREEENDEAYAAFEKEFSANNQIFDIADLAL